MSRIRVHTRLAIASMSCDKCGKTARSSTYKPSRFGEEEHQLAAYFSQGWRLYAAGNGQRVYCPEHSPTVPMYLVLGPENPPR